MTTIVTTNTNVPTPVGVLGQQNILKISLAHCIDYKKLYICQWIPQYKSIKIWSVCILWCIYFCALLLAGQCLWFVRIKVVNASCTIMFTIISTRHIHGMVTIWPAPPITSNELLKIHCAVKCFNKQIS